jgi:hypothetical protein
MVLVSPFLLSVSAVSVSQAMPQGAGKGSGEQQGLTWTEAYEGSGNSDGFVTDLNSTVGYIFGKHFAMNMGVPYLLITPSTSKTGTTSAYGMGNLYLGLRYSEGTALDFSTSLNSAIRTASTKKGLSTGHVTVDWSNYFARGFDLFIPFVDLGLANSIPDSRFLHRAYTSYGTLAHVGATAAVCPASSTHFPSALRSTSARCSRTTPGCDFGLGSGPHKEFLSWRARTRRAEVWLLM